MAIRFVNKLSVPLIPNSWYKLRLNVKDKHAKQADIALFVGRLTDLTDNKSPKFMVLETVNGDQPSFEFDDEMYGDKSTAGTLTVLCRLAEVNEGGN